MQRSFALWLAAGLVIAQAQSGSPAQADQHAAPASLVELHDTVAAAHDATEQTIEALVGLMNAPPGRVRDEYREYAKHASAMEKQAARVDSESREVERRGAEWLAEWRESDAEVSNAELRELAQQQREEMAWRFGNIESSLSAARDALGPFLQNLEDVERDADEDTKSRESGSSGGTDAVQAAIADARQAKIALEIALSDVQMAIRAAAIAVAAAG